MKNGSNIYSLPFVLVYLILLILFSSTVSASNIQLSSSSRPYAYITNHGSNTVSVIDTATNTVTATVPVGSSPWGVAVSPDGTRVYVTNWNSNTVSVIDTATNTVTATVNVRSNPIGVAVSPDGKKVYVAIANCFSSEGSGTVDVIDTATNNVTASVNIWSNPIGIAVTPDGTKVYVASLYDGVYVIDIATNTVTASVPVGHTVEGIAVSPDGSNVYVTHSDIENHYIGSYDIDTQAVSVINTTTNEVTTTVSVNGPTTGVVFNQAGTKAYVANWWSGNVSVINVATNNVTATVIVGSHPEGIAISPDGSNVYVANENSNTVSVIDTNTNAVTASTEVGNNPVAFGQFIASVPVQLLLPVANFSSNVVEGYAPLAVQFVDLSLNATGWHWDFGDGANSTEQNPTHTYSSSGNYNVNLIVSNGNSTDSKLATLNVSEKPVLPIVNFSTNVTSGYAPLSVQFMDDSILSLPPRHQVVTEADNGKSISLENGETFYIRLKECADGAYFWGLSFTPGLCILSESYIDDNPHPEEPVPDGMMPWIGGGMAVHVWEIKAVAQGIQQVKGRPSYNRIGPEDNFTLNITNLPQNITSGNWDFGDGANSTEQNPTHTYFSAGNYTINLRVTNANGTDSKNAIITVSEKPVLPIANFSSDDESRSGGSSHSSSSSGGGGAGGSPEPQNNVEAKELSQTYIASGQSVKFDFPQKATPVVYISFDSKKTAGKTTTISEMLKAKSTLVSGSPSDEVYKFLNIWVGNSGFATSKNIENAVVNFKVAKSWVQDKKIDKSSITLNRYSDNSWNQLPTSLSSEDDNYLYLTAKTPGFSPFAITGKSTAAGTIQPAAGDKTQTANVNETQTETNVGNTTANTEQTPAQKASPSTSAFEFVFGVAGFLAVFLYKRKSE